MQSNQPFITLIRENISLSQPKNDGIAVVFHVLILAFLKNFAQK